MPGAWLGRAPGTPLVRCRVDALALPDLPQRTKQTKQTKGKKMMKLDLSVLERGTDALVRMADALEDIAFQLNEMRHDR